MGIKLKIAAAVVALLVASVVGGIALMGGGDDAETPAASPRDEASPSATPSPSDSPTPKKSPSTKAPECEGPNDQFNVEGVRQESLLPDCGTRAVSLEEERKSGLTLACGGKHPVILYKTNTSGAKTSVCGRNASGEQFRIVVQPEGGAVTDVKGSYNPGADSFVGKAEDGTRYEVLAYDGTLVITRPDGTRDVQDSDDDWISLDNEPDYD